MCVCFRNVELRIKLYSTYNTRRHSTLLRLTIKSYLDYATDHEQRISKNDSLTERFYLSVTSNNVFPILRVGPIFLFYSLQLTVNLNSTHFINLEKYIFYSDIGKK